ncbi:MAG: cobalamin-binding protein [Planctomycetales bacterium]|nr:cobalamin-binding protein [Planctomycetales bacterium]
MPNPRVVSLLPSATEIVAAVGCESWLVGRSHECDFPPGVRHLPVCSESKIDVSAGSAEIDRQVKSLLRDALSIYRVHSHVLRELAPDIILTQTQCEVCAVSQRDVEQAVCEITGCTPTIVSLEPHCLRDVWSSVRQVADALGVPARGHDVAKQLESRVRTLAERTVAMPHHPRVACIEWFDPLMSAGNWIPELVEIAGGVNLFGEVGRHSPWMMWDDLMTSDPDVIVLLPCGWDIERSRRELPVLTERPEWTRLRAVRDGQVFVTDGNQFFNRPGPRWVESAEILAELLHPQSLNFGHHGTGWQLA